MRRVTRGGLAALTLLSAGLSAGGLAGPAAAQGAGDVTRGLAAFTDRCGSCHAIDETHQGPKLRGVVGRPAASIPGFAYSDALKASGLVWTPAALDKFLTRPTKAVPGTAMRAVVPDPTERRDLIAYLASNPARRR
jgi:cytochrome c